jgi:hypothetical protein
MLLKKSSCVFIDTNGASAAITDVTIGRDAITATIYFIMMIFPLLKFIFVDPNLNAYVAKYIGVVD